MKTLKLSTLAFVIILSSLSLFSCEETIESDFQQYPSSEAFANSGSNRIPTIKRITRQDFPDAIGWRISWFGGNLHSNNDFNKVPAIFSTVTGTVRSVNTLNNSSSQLTKDADMWLYNNLKAPRKLFNLDHLNHAKRTRFKVSGMKVSDLQNAAQNQPGLFGIAYEWDLNEPNGKLVISSYKEGQIFSFKTDRTPAKYGAVRIVKKYPLILEVVVQK
ncbi:MAG: hypothetical protein ACFB15_28535 [Cyclobacteriaceae bacterium]